MILQTRENNIDFTLISAYIDNECSEAEKLLVNNYLQTESSFRKMYEFEKRFTSGYRIHLRKSNPPDDVIKKIIDSIESETKRRKERILKQKKLKTITYRYLYPAAAVLIIFLGYYLFSSLLSKDRDFIHQSHNIFTKVENNEMNLQHLTSDANELQKILSKSSGFNVFVPELKDAVLIGGTVNELNEARVVHFVHRRNGNLIYTMQMNRNDLIEKDKLFLHKNHMQEISEGHNWIECEKNNNDCTVIWYKNEVICSSVSKLDAKEIATVLTNYK